MKNPEATIVIVTKDRCEELKRALESSVRQEGRIEIIVIDDGSKDASPEMVKNCFPQIQLVCGKHSRGCVVRRNEGARLANSHYIISIDDDAEFSSPQVVKQALENFTDPRIGAVAIPYTNAPDYTEVLQKSPCDDENYFTSQFIGTAYAIRRDLFLRLGGFDETLVHQGEERDFCVRMLAAGSYVKLGTGEPVHHHISSQRNHVRMAYYGRRNDIRFVWQYVPFPQVYGRLLGTVVSGLILGLTSGFPRETVKGVFSGFLYSIKKGRRIPVSSSVYRIYRGMRGRAMNICLRND